MTTQSSAPDLTMIKARQQRTWAAGDFAEVATTLAIVGESLSEVAELQAGWQVLDVATGSGNTAIAAARRFCDVTGVDYVPALLERGLERAAAERLPIAFREGDAEDLPFAAASFDATLSSFGVMFAPNQELAAREMLRVTRPGGVIALANWTPDGFIGEMFKVNGRHVPPPAGLKSPLLWGTAERLHELFGDEVTSITATRRNFVFRYRSPEHWLQFFRAYYGPTLKAFEALDAAGQQALAADLIDLATRSNAATGNVLAMPAAYLEVVMVRR